MAREVREETGLSIDAVPREDRFHFISIPNGTVIFRRYFVDAAAADTADAIRTFVAGEADPEIEGPVVIFDRDNMPDGLAPQMRPLIDWHFANPWSP
jgi:8-oxo-dGTP pyrophosphatase MutT (NUDIX family)